MPNITTTNNDNGGIEVKGGQFHDEALLFTGADTYVAGTLLARKTVSDTIGIAYTRAGTSTYTAAGASNAGATLEIGDYVVTAGTLSSGVGTWTAVAPSGKHEQFTSTADTDDLLFPNLGFTLTVTATPSTTWDTGDVITMTPAAQSGQPLVAYVIAGHSGAQTPVAVLQYEIVVTGAGTEYPRVIEGGEVNFTRLVVDADGDNSNITGAIRDLLKSNGIFAVPVQQLAHVDNPQP